MQDVLLDVGFKLNNMNLQEAKAILREYPDPDDYITSRTNQYSASISFLTWKEAVKTVLNALPEWYKTSESLPGDFPVKIPVTGQLVMTWNDAGRYYQQVTYRDWQEFPGYWYPFELIKPI